MFGQIIHFSVRNKLIIALFTIALIAGGLYSLSQIPINAVPDITNNQVQVVTSSPSLSAEEVERFITYPIEISMANLPGVSEIRSISRYGLSVVTVVFSEEVAQTVARQFVSEQIDLALQEIPEGMGNPELMPITTGLGEIYQYTLEVEEGRAQKYSAMELRTIQDWIVKRQLSGIRGIIEVSSFGGYLKQYQVSVDPGRLRSYGLTIGEVVKALEANNQNTGGSYLERGSSAYYIRAEGIVGSPEEISNIVVKQEGRSPVLLRHLARVEEGYPPRYGAMTKNGKGEAVGGILLMLKDANSSETLNNIHERIAEIQPSLPDGVKIVPYLDRSDLVARTTGTIKTNLLEGGLIVIFVLVLLLGNLRAGFIVASVIPLSLLFAFIMMHMFGVSANLMSLGALDFGIVVDGAVIIVEGVLHALFAGYAGRKLSQPEMDEVVARSSSSIYKSAAFGVLIIIVVFIPIMSLTGIEGKMFRPMAQTVSFAILGALILSLTYVPMMAALLLKKKVVVKKTISDRIMNALSRVYQPLLKSALRHRIPTLAAALGLLVLSLFIFSRLGGVFIPNLEEGDIAMQMTLPTGSSLQESIRTSTQAERILLDNFPEVKQVVSKIGTAEVPTDPMSVELADIMVVLKDKSEWTSADSREELVRKMNDKLAVIMGASFDFTQPIQLRFNELMTGAKTDVAIKIFGEDMEVLHRLGSEAAALVAGIPGAADIQLEQTEGLPQLLVKYDRAKVARYGISIEELNSTIRTAFAGEKAGVVFEGEKKFDLVVRLDGAEREAFNLGRLYIHNASGEAVPLSELTTVEEAVGPAQISRDNTRRRVILGINVRERDIESLVEDVQLKLGQQMELPAGYTISYGGDFENLRQAKERLQLAVPVALVMILLLLYFAFHSFKYAMLIFMAVPLSVIGGILALWVRDLPFSISAGVGFIALFGVAVLNGIVLISYFNELKEEGKWSLEEVVLKGGLVRLRPVILTASVAALGFLPMALSTTAGAEVQRPLATVVIGGLISATFLTLVVLPILYVSMEEISRRRIKRKGIAASFTVGIILLLASPANAQEPVGLRLTEAEAVRLAINQNPDLKVAGMEVVRQQQQRKASIALPSTTIGMQYGQINSPNRDPYWEVSQSLGRIPAHFQRVRLHKQYVKGAEQQEQLSERELILSVRLAWQRWLYLRQVVKEMEEQLSWYAQFEERISLQYRLGEIGQLERSMAQNGLFELRNAFMLRSEEQKQAEEELKFLLYTESSIEAEIDTLLPLPLPVSGGMVDDHPRIGLLAAEALSRKGEAGLERAGLFPELSVGYFYQDLTEIDIGFKGLNGWMLELSVPLWFLPRQAAIQRSRIQQLQAEERLKYGRKELGTRRHNNQSRLNQYQQLLRYYEEQGLEQAMLIKETASLQLEAGEIDSFQYLQSMQRATSSRLQYFEALHLFNQTVVEFEFLSK